jgi:hypothetical protein
MQGHCNGAGTSTEGGLKQVVFWRCADGLLMATAEWFMGGGGVGGGGGGRWEGP